MLETEVVLDYSCSHCQHPVNVKLKCSGDGLAAGPHAVASVSVPCPSCAATCGLYCELSGLVLAVLPEARRQTLEPSLN